MLRALLFTHSVPIPKTALETVAFWCMLIMIIMYYIL